MKHKHLKICLSIFLLILLSVNEAYAQTLSTEIFSPTFSVVSGRHNTDIQVQLATPTSDAAIYYTLDGTEPGTNSQLYTGAIQIAGNGTYKTLKAITITQNNEKSLISSAIYKIDYSFDPNADYLTDLTWNEYNDLLIGNWFGYASTPWTNDYCVQVSILPTGNYIDSATSRGWEPVVNDTFTDFDFFFPVFYYGVSHPSPLKTIELYDILASGYATGFITIDFDVSTNVDELRSVKFLDENNLYLEMWHHSQYGPLKYYLTKNPNPTTGIDGPASENALIYPNPASDLVTIKDLNSDVEFINELGQSFLIEKNETLFVADLPKGFYIVSYQNSAGTQIKQKLILE